MRISVQDYSDMEVALLRNAKYETVYPYQAHRVLFWGNSNVFSFRLLQEGAPEEGFFR